MKCCRVKNDYRFEVTFRWWAAPSAQFYGFHNSIRNEIDQLTVRLIAADELWIFFCVEKLSQLKCTVIFVR